MRQNSNNIQGTRTPDPLNQLFQGIYHTLETYSNVHRGSGHKSLATTHLFDRARTIVLDFLELDKRKNVVIFCSPYRAVALCRVLAPGSYTLVSSDEFGLPLGVRAIAVRKKCIHKGMQLHVGGGTTQLYDKDWVIWAREPDRYEAGTPAIVNIIAFAKALLLMKEHGNDIFQNLTYNDLSADEILYDDEWKSYSGQDLLTKLSGSVIGRGLPVPTTGGQKPFINLDNSASTPAFEAVWMAFRETFTMPPAMRQKLTAEVRSAMAGVLGAPESEYDVIFTSNTTESINLVADSFSMVENENLEPVILTTILEHSSNDLPWRRINGHSVIRLEVNKEGFWEMGDLESVLEAYNQKHIHGNKRIRLVAVSGASNVLGACNDLDALSRIVHGYGAQLLVDAAQLIAHRQVNMKQTGIDYLAFSGHKIYAPFGCGALVARKGLLPEPLKIAATAAGDENTGGIAAIGKSLLLLQRIGFDVIGRHEQSLTSRALNAMKDIPGLTVHGIKETESAEFSKKIGVIIFDIKDMMAGSIAHKLARNRGIGVRYGCHCAHLIVKQLANFTPFQERLQKAVVLMVPSIKLQGFVRISFGLENTEADVDAFIHELSEIAMRKHPKARDAKDVRKPALLMNKAEVKKMMSDYIYSVERRIYLNNFPSLS